MVGFCHGGNVLGNHYDNDWDYDDDPSAIVWYSLNSDIISSSTFNPDLPGAGDIPPFDGKEELLLRERERLGSPHRVGRTVSQALLRIFWMIIVNDYCQHRNHGDGLGRLFTIKTVERSPFLVLRLGRGFQICAVLWTTVIREAFFF